MAILKAIGNTGKSKSSLRNVINYVGKKAEATQGILCSNDYEKIYEQFNQTKDFYNKNEGRQYKHYVISFEAKDNITKDEALKISEDFIENNLKGYEGFIAIHNDKNLHSHIVINSVSLETGKKYNESSKDYARIKDNLHNYLEQNYNLKKVEKKEKNISSYDKNKYKVIENDLTKNKKSDIVNLAKNYNSCLKDSLSKEDFIEKMKDKKEFEIQWDEAQSDQVLNMESFVKYWHDGAWGGFIDESEKNHPDWAFIFQDSETEPLLIEAFRQYSHRLYQPIIENYESAKNLQKQGESA